MIDKITIDVKHQVDRGIVILKQGGLVAFPTDTVYGLGVCAGQAQAVERVYAVKERPRNIALPLLLADTLQVGHLSQFVPEIAWLLARHFWPGALTLVLYKSSLVPDFVTAGETTVAVRVPSHPVPVALIEALGSPIVGTSANLSGQPGPLTADGVRAQFGDKIDLIIDGGRCPGGRESTIVDVTGETPVVLREGAISTNEIQRICGVVRVKNGLV